MCGYFVGRRSRRRRDTAADTSVAAAAFGYRPQTSLRDGLAAMVATERVSKGALR